MMDHRGDIVHVHHFIELVFGLPYVALGVIFLFEAQALGCPVAAPSTYAYPEQLGDAALFFDPWSVDEIAGCIERLWTDDALCAEMAAKGRENVRRLLPGRFAARLAEVIELTLERGL